MTDGPAAVVVFLDLSIGGREVGRVKIRLFSEQVPRTAENFRQLCTGEFRRGGVPVGYKGATFHRIIRGFMIQGGDIVRRDGTGTTSIYGDRFEDESLAGCFDSAGLVAMANSGPNTNGCQFFITCAPCDFLNGKHVIVGQVVEGMQVVRLAEEVPVSGSTPRLSVVISDCGEM